METPYTCNYCLQDIKLENFCPDCGVINRGRDVTDLYSEENTKYFEQYTKISNEEN